MQANKNRIRKGHYTTAFTTLPNSTLQSRDLTPEALGVLCRIISYPTSWALYKEQLESELKGTGRDKLTRIFKELQELGYMCKVLVRDEHTGRILTTEWHVYPEPQTDLIQQQKPEQLETRSTVPEQLETRPTENPSDGKPAAIKETLTEKKQYKTTTTKTREREIFDFEFYSCYANGSAAVQTPPKWAARILLSFYPNLSGDELKSTLSKQFGGFVVFNLSADHQEMPLIRAQSLFTRWLENGKHKPVKTPSRAAELQINPIQHSDVERVVDFERPIVTPGEEMILKRGEIPPAMQLRLSDEEFKAILLQYNIHLEK